MKVRTRMELGVLMPIVVGIGTILTISMFMLPLTPLASTIALTALVAIAILIVAGIVYQLNRTLTDRIERLIQAADRVSVGEFREVDGDMGKDEIANVSTVFNQMVNELKSYMQLLEEHRALTEDLDKTKQALESFRNTDVNISDGLERLERAQGQLVQQERRHALARMFPGIAHDVNEALMGIRASAELATTQNPSESIRGNLDTILSLSDELAEEVARLMRFHSLPNRAAETVDLQAVIEDALRLSEPKWKQEAFAKGATVTIKREFQPVPRIIANRMDLVQAILSLIFNAIEAMPQGGVLTFRLEPKDGNRMLLTITDTGVGMSDSVLRRCCRPFFSTKEDGAGVGLTIASSIVRDHNGKFGIVSHVGTGTSVYVEFSTDDSDAGTSSGAKPVSTLALPSSLRLLLVEDDHWVADIVTRMFAREGLAVTVATNGRLGLEVFRAGAFDVVITDRAMPEMNGYELAAAVKKIAPETPIILMTGFADAMQSEGRLPPHIDAVMGKPVTLARLRQSVVEVLGSRKHLKSSADQSITPRK